MTVPVQILKSSRDPIAAGRILHFNVDKGLLVADKVDCRSGGGRVIEPMRLAIGDRYALADLWRFWEALACGEYEVC